MDNQYQAGYNVGYNAGEDRFITNRSYSTEYTNVPQVTEWGTGWSDGFDTGYQQAEYEANRININGTLFEQITCKCGWKYVIVTTEFIEALNTDRIEQEYFKDRLGCWGFYNNIIEPFEWLAHNKEAYCLNNKCNVEI